MSGQLEVITRFFTLRYNIWRIPRFFPPHIRRCGMPKFVNHPWKNRHYGSRRKCKVAGCGVSAAEGSEYCNKCLGADLLGESVDDQMVANRRAAARMRRS